MTRLSLILCLALSACSFQPPQSAFLPAALAGKVEVLESSESICGQDCDSEILKQAIKPPGNGGISSGLLVRLNDDVTVYRLWNGPNAGLNDYGSSNRIGAWWTADKPSGKREDYRRLNAICLDWKNDLAWEVKCTLKKGTVVAVGPTQSADCKIGPSYSANPTLQIYVDNVASRYVSCPKVASENKSDSDFEVNPNDLSSEQPQPIAEANASPEPPDSVVKASSPHKH